MTTGHRPCLSTILANWTMYAKPLLAATSQRRHVTPVDTQCSRLQLASEPQSRPARLQPDQRANTSRYRLPSEESLNSRPVTQHPFDGALGPWCAAVFADRTRGQFQG